MNNFVDRIDHVNIVVKDLNKVKKFFLALGFTQEDKSRLVGDWISETVGLEGVDARYVKLLCPATMYRSSCSNSNIRRSVKFPLQARRTPRGTGIWHSGLKISRGRFHFSRTQASSL